MPFHRQEVTHRFEVIFSFQSRFRPANPSSRRQPVVAVTCLSSFHHPEVKSTPSEQFSVVPSSRHSFQCHPSVPVSRRGALFRCHPTVVQKSRRRHPITLVSFRLRPNSPKSFALFKRFPCIPRSFEIISRPSKTVSRPFQAVQCSFHYHPTTISGRFMFISRPSPDNSRPFRGHLRPFPDHFRSFPDHFRPFHDHFLPI